MTSTIAHDTPDALPTWEDAKNLRQCDVDELRTGDTKTGEQGLLSAADVGLVRDRLGPSPGLADSQTGGLSWIMDCPGVVCLVSCVCVLYPTKYFTTLPGIWALLNYSS